MKDFSSQDIYFGGAGFSCAFYIGVVKAFRELYPNQIPNIHADSAGALVGLSYALEVPTALMENAYFNMCDNCRKKGIWFGAISTEHDILMDTLFKLGKFKNIQNNSKFTVGITSFFNQYQIYSNWDETKIVRKYVHKSMTIPFLTKTHPTMEIDGAFTTKKEYDITIGTSAGFDIFTPTSWKQNMSIPTKKQGKYLIDLGYIMTKKYALIDTKKSVLRFDPIYTTLILLFLWPLKVLAIFCSFVGCIE